LTQMVNPFYFEVF